MDEVLTPADIVTLLRVDTATVTQLLESGEIVAFKVGSEWRVLSQALLDFIAQGTKQQQLSALKRTLSDPRTWARALEEYPDFKESILAREFPDDSIGAFLKGGVATLEAEAKSGKVIEMKPRTKE